MRYWTVVIDAFDGLQYGLLRVAVQAETQEKAEAKARKQALDDGYVINKVMFILGG